jgi:trimeric autotransporter adhesin
MTKHRCSRPANLTNVAALAKPAKLAILATTMLVGACGAHEDQPADPEAAPSPELAAARPELEKVINHLARLDHTGLPGVAEGAAGDPLVMQTGPQADRIFVAIADGNEEVPPVTTRAVAQMALILDSDRGDILFALQHNVAQATLAHIHRAPGGAEGPITVVLDHRRAFSVGQARLSAADVANLRAGRMYINVHSTARADGEVRGQLLRLGETLYTGTLSGSQEVPDVKTSGRGAFAAILDSERGRIRCEGAFEGLLTPSTVAHIHEGIAGINGEIRFGLTIRPPGRTSGALSGAFDVARADAALLDNAGLYVNVHSTMFTLGEIRGQITRK